MKQQGSDQAPQAPNILIVEDNKAVTRAIYHLLRHAGYEPVVFHAAGPALHYTEQHTPSAALIDIHLPDFNGLVLSQKLRQRFGPEVPIIVLSGDTSMETLNSLPHVGATYFISKPINASALLDQMKLWLGGAQQADEQNAASGDAPRGAEGAAGL